MRESEAQFLEVWAVATVRVACELLWTISLGLGEVVMHLQTVVKEAGILNALHLLHCLDNSILIEAVHHHPLIDVTSNLLVGLN